MRYLSLLAIVALLSVTGCGGSTAEYFYPENGTPAVWNPPDPAQRAQELQALVDQALADNQIPGAIVGVSTPAGEWTSTTGFADIAAQHPPSLQDFSAWRSVTKSLTVTVVLQLVGEGKLDLDKSVSTYVQGVPGGDKITLRQLANMTSGLFNYSADSTFQQTLIQDLDRSYTLDELLTFAFSHPLNFQPGTAYEYSNTNTLVLQKIAETVTGQGLEQLFRTRFFARLPAGSVEYLTTSTLPTPHLNGYYYDDDAQAFEELEVNGTGFAGAGAMVGTMAGLREWGRLLVSGVLLPKEIHAQRFISRPPTNGPIYDSYGLGMGELGGWWGHTGTGLGYQVCVLTEPTTLSSIVIFVNGANEDEDVPAKLARRIQTVLGWRR